MHNFVVNVLRRWPCRISAAERNFFREKRRSKLNIKILKRMIVQHMSNGQNQLRWLYKETSINWMKMASDSNSDSYDSD